MSEEIAPPLNEATASPRPPTPAVHWLPPRQGHRLAFVLTLALIVIVVVSLPFALASIRTQLFSEQAGDLYDLVSGQPLPPVAVAAGPRGSSSFVSISIVRLDVSTQLVTLSIAASRTCPTACPTLDLTLVAAANTAAELRGVPPSATVTLRPSDQLFLQTVQLPIRGQPSLYPFDTWRLWLGLTLTDVRPDGSRVPLTVAQLPSQASVTLQNVLPDFLMAPPTPIAPAQVAAVHAPMAFAAIDRLVFSRPAYLQVLSLVLVVLITVSGLLALFTRSINELVLGVGGLILGIWGVRSILVPQPVPTITAIDLALSTVILLLLLGLAVRAALHFHAHSEWPWMRPHAEG